MKSSLNVAIVGGGWAGLAAAVELCAAGAKVTVFEAARQLGGRARRFETRGHRLDNGQHILIGAYRETLRLMHTVGADSEHQLLRIPLDLNYPGAGFRMRLFHLPAPWHLAFGLLATKGCTLGEKLAAARFMRALQASNYRLSADCTVSELLDCHDQPATLRRFLWEPLCIAALNTIPEIASAQIFANVLRDTLGGACSDTDLLLPTTDLGCMFPDSASKFITTQGSEIRLSTRVDAIKDGLCIGEKHFDHIVLATAPQHASILLIAHAETSAIVHTLADFRYEPIATVYAGYPPDVRLPSPMLGLDSGVERRLGQWAFDRGTLGNASGIIGFVLSAHGAWDTHDNATLIEVLHHELEEVLGRELPQPLWHQVIREHRATFSCRPNLSRPSTQTAIPGLWLAGDYVCADYPATLEGAVRSGVAAARGILQSR